MLLCLTCCSSVDTCRMFTANGPGPGVRTFFFVLPSKFEHGIAPHTPNPTNVISAFYPGPLGHNLSQLQHVIHSIKTLLGQEAQPTSSTHLCEYFVIIVLIKCIIIAF